MQIKFGFCGLGRKFPVVRPVGKIEYQWEKTEPTTVFWYIMKQKYRRNAYQKLRKFLTMQACKPRRHQKQ